MIFEEAKKLLLESVDEAKNLNDLLHTVVDKIYLKGYEDGVRTDSVFHKTNQEKMCSLSPEEFYKTLKWLRTVYGMQFTSSEDAIIDWLRQEVTE